MSTTNQFHDIDMKEHSQDADFEKKTARLKLPRIADKHFIRL